MALCPSGHQSQTTDYCDTCGALMGGAPVTPASASVSQSVPAAAGGGAAEKVGGSCPQCGADRDGRFCEECGYDYELAALVPPAPVSPELGSTAVLAPDPAAPDPLAQTAALPPDYDLDAEFEAAERAFAESGGASATPQAATASPATPAPAASATSSPLAVVVTVDQEYYDAQVERGDIVAAEFPFPKYHGERRFALDADRIRIGRASASRGIAVEIDLTGPPLDPAVSHLHAQLLRGPDGAWCVVDLDSANGTRLNGGEDPLAAETEVPVKAGDRIHLGVWTTLTIEEA